MTVPLQPGQILARGVCRHLRQYDFASVTEFVPCRGLRVDVLALGPKSEIWVIECKSSRMDFMSDSKWEGYLPWCDRFFWAVDDEFPQELLPVETGLIITDGYDAEIQRWPEPQKLAAARRKSMIHRFARTAATRLQGVLDPKPSGNVEF